MAREVRAHSVALTLGLALAGCDPNIQIGGNATDAATNAPPDATNGFAPITFPWSTGFENGFADYQLQ